VSKTPEQVGPYRIVRELGRGGMAVVYLAKQPVLARSVALKELAPFLAGDPSLAQRFIREAQVAGSLSHPNVVTVFDFLEHEGVPYIAMEYLERGSLRPFVGRMSAAQVAGVLEGLLAALSHAEAMQIVHRDVKPENLLVTGEGGVKIADFGIAKAMQQVATEEMLTPAGATVGTPAYMAPEQAMAQEIGGWTDLYQTGVVAFELLAGAVPFRSEGSPVAVLMQHITDPVPPLPAGTDPALEAWVRRMMEKDPADRPPDARTAWDELEDIILAIEGPRWRRDARLGEHEPTAEHPTPLTPARFSSWQNYVPEEGSATPPPPPPPATTPVPPSPDPAFTSGYVEFVRPGEQTARETPAEPPPPVLAEPPAALTPDPEPPAAPGRA
jgi:serine/threonine protein kinase